MEDLIEFLHKIGRLKKTKRLGWVHYKVPNPESVAEHTFRTAVLALVISEKLGFDKNKCVKMALIHDLAESLVGDLTPWEGVGEEEKHEREKKAMRELTEKLDNEEILELWNEYEERNTPEAKFVWELDRVEMLLQAYEYEKEHKDVSLEEFWKSWFDKVENPELKKILEILKETGSS